MRRHIHKHQVAAKHDSDHCSLLSYKQILQLDGCLLLYSDNELDGHESESEHGLCRSAAATERLRLREQWLFEGFGSESVGRWGLQ